MNSTTMTCDCCGGMLPSREIWEHCRDSVDGECTGSVDAHGRCRAFGADEWALHAYTVQTDAFSVDLVCESLDEAIREAFDGEIKGIIDEDSLRRKFAKYVADGGYCWIEEDGERVLEIGRD